VIAPPVGSGSGSGSG